MIAKTTVDRILLNSKEAAYALGISTRMLWSLTDQEKIQAVRIGRLVMYSPEVLRAFANSQNSIK